MKKLKRISLVPGIQILNAMEQQLLHGTGDFDPNVCHSKSSRYTCYSSCVDYEGYPGYCVWVDRLSSCKCAVGFIG